MKLGPVFFSALAALSAFTAGLTAQRHASVGVGVGTVRHAGGSSFSAATLSPAAQLLSPSWYLGAGGSVSILEAGVWAWQGRADVWAAVPRSRVTGARLAVSATMAASMRSDGGAAAGAGSGVVELVWGAGRQGAALGVGAAGGVIESVAPVGALRLRARSWWQPAGGPAQLAFIAEGTRFFGSWYTDLVAGATLERPRLVASLWVSARVSSAYGSTGSAIGTLQYFLTPSLALEASGGNYLRDPFQGLPRAGFGSGGVRFFIAPRTPPVEAVPTSVPSGLAPLVAQHRGGGDTVVVRFRMDGARAVAIAGNWNAWTPQPLRGLGEDIWEAALLLAPGTYYFSLVADGEWVVPGGVAVVSDGMGGLVAVLTVL